MKKMLSIFLAITLLASLVGNCFIAEVQALSTTYSVSSSYASSSFYSNLCNVELTGNLRTDIVNVALSQVGYYEGNANGDYDGGNSGTYNNYCEYNYWYHNYVSSGMPVGGSSAPWCATFVSWCARQAGVSESIIKNSTAAGHGAAYFNLQYAAGGSQASDGTGFLGNYYTPKPGDLFYKSDWSHVGLVWYVDGSYFYTIEGNTNNNGSSQGNGVYSLRRKIADCYFGVPNYPNTSITHTIDNSYGTNFTAYPKAKITAENIFDAYHGQIDSTSWIGTSDKCTIHEVYTDGCCKVTYPLDAGGTKTVYSKISLFDTHTHSYTGVRVYENAHPHRISQRCVDYTTCGGWVWTDEYYEVKTCEQCWYVDFDIGASSVSVKVGESKTISATLSGCLPDSAVMYRSFSPDNDVAEVTIKNQQATFTGLKEGTTSFSLTVYSDSTKSHVIGTTTIPVSVTGCESSGHNYVYKVTTTPTTSANGKLTGTCSICSETTTLPIPKFSEVFYTYKVVKAATCTTAGTGRYTWNTTTYGNYYFDVIIAATGHSYSYKTTKAPTTSAVGTLTGSCTKCSSTTSVTLPKLTTTDYSYAVTKAATCTTTGTGRYTWKTTTYGSFYFDVTISALGHNYASGSCTRCSASDPDYAVDPDAPQIIVGSATAFTGNTVSIPILIKNNPGITSMKLKIAFSSELTLTSISYNSEIGGQFQMPQTMTSPVTLNWVNGMEDAEGDWTYATLTFAVAEGTSSGTTANITVTYDPDDVYDITESNVSFAVQNGCVTIMDYMPGDITGDGKVNNKDVTRLLQYLSDWDVEVIEAALDITGDGKVNNKDVTRLLQYLSGWDVEIN